MIKVKKAGTQAGSIRPLKQQQTKNFLAQVCLGGPSDDSAEAYYLTIKIRGSTTTTSPKDNILLNNAVPKVKFSTLANSFSFTSFFRLDDHFEAVPLPAGCYLAVHIPFLPQKNTTFIDSVMISEIVIEFKTSSSSSSSSTMKLKPVKVEGYNHRRSLSLLHATSSSWSLNCRPAARNALSSNSITGSSSSITFANIFGLCSAVVVTFEVPSDSGGLHLPTASFSITVDDSADVLAGQSKLNNNNNREHESISVDNNNNNKRQHNFEDCPLEILTKILSYVNTAFKFRTLIALAGTCRRFRDVTMKADPSCLFSVVDLHNHSAPSSEAYSLLLKSGAASALRHLRLAEIDKFPLTTATNSLLKAITLSTLCVQSCGFVDDPFLEVICRNQAKSLETLDISGCTKITAKGFSKLSQLRGLRRLAFRGLRFDVPLARGIFANLKLLQVVDMAETRLPDVDAVCVELSTASPHELKSIRLGTAPYLSDAGLTALLTLKQLEELSITWPTKRPEFSFLSWSCPAMRRISSNIVYKEDFAIWAQFMSNLEQVDVREHSEIDVPSACELLERCPKMSLLTFHKQSHYSEASSSLSLEEFHSQLVRRMRSSTQLKCIIWINQDG